jgi:hypothetical protein
MPTQRGVQVRCWSCGGRADLNTVDSRKSLHGDCFMICTSAQRLCAPGTYASVDLTSMHFCNDLRNHDNGIAARAHKVQLRVMPGINVLPGVPVAMDGHGKLPSIAHRW